ncbi:30S ribosomal protein S6 [Holosporaceae bacterium 'Namur']|nr:30S ribosomal protein S6 [Holosporaceae bacterium 'Namur']
MTKMAFYDSIFILRQDISEADVHKIAGKFIDIATNLGATLIKKEYWRVRQLAYIVKKNKKGHYVYLGLSASSDVIKELERNYKIDENVIMFSNIKVDRIDDAPTPMMQAPSDIGSFGEAAEV